MNLSRMDLADIGSPERLAIEIFRLAPELKYPIDLYKICKFLDISQIQPITSDEYEGGLITDREKSTGIILYNKKSPKTRIRFTIAHELGHFLIPTHKELRFNCSLADLSQASRHSLMAQMETEANLFAANLLMPAHLIRPMLGREPSLEKLLTLAENFVVSKEAMARRYIELIDRPVAIIITKNDMIARIYRGKGFPYVVPSLNQPVPRGSNYHLRRPRSADPKPCVPDEWIDVEYGKRAPEMFESIKYFDNNLSFILIEHCANETYYED